MRFLVDENLPAGVSEVLQTRGHDVVWVSQSEHRGASDQEIWRLAALEGRIVITRDLDFPLQDMPKPPGLVLLRVPDSFTKRQITNVVSDFVGSDAFERIAEAITVVSPGRVRSRGL